jgi:predicted transcriptional regulator
MNDAEEFVYDCLLHNGFFGPQQWVRPMDLGRPSAMIYRGLQGLIKRGLVERRLRLGSRGSYVYRLTEEGLRRDPELR